MIEVEDLSQSEITELLERVGYGHLGCCLDDRPYVVPVHYAYKDGLIYLYTTEGKKAAMIRENPNVCLQVEAVIDNEHWQSIIVDGVATQLEAGPERDKALALIVEVSPTLTPAVSVRWMDHWVRENIEVLYRVKPTATSGRRAVDQIGDRPFASTGSVRDKIV
jgi:uncharacterized protein